MIAVIVTARLSLEDWFRLLEYTAWDTLWVNMLFSACVLLFFSSYGVFAAFKRTIGMMVIVSTVQHHTIVFKIIVLIQYGIFVSFLVLHQIAVAIIAFSLNYSEVMLTSLKRLIRWADDDFYSRPMNHIQEKVIKIFLTFI